MILPRQVGLAELAYLQHQFDSELELQARIIKGRELYAGYMDEDLALVGSDIYVGGDETDIEGVNLMAIAINTTVRRVTLQGFTVPSPKEMGDGSGDLGDDVLLVIQAWVNKVYEVNKVNTLSRDLHRWTERDGEAFLVLDYDLEYLYDRDPTQTGIPRFYVHERYTDAGTAWKGIVGSNEGMKAHYRNGDANQPLDMVSKRWIEDFWEDDEIKSRQRMTLYIGPVGSELVGDLVAARIEKYALNDAGEWEQYKDLEDLEWPIWWTDSQQEQGASLPLPVVHFRNEEFEPGMKKIWGLQASMDQQWIAFNNSELMAGHQLLVAFGFYPTTDGKAPEEDGGNLLKAVPRQIIGTQAKSPREADVKAINPPSAEPLLNGLDKTAIYASFVGSLPVSNFIFSKAVAASETLKQGDAELVAKVNDLIMLWGQSWSAVFDVARKMENIFNSGSLDERPKIKAQFAPPERRDMIHLQKEASAKREAGVPEEQLLVEIWNYTPDQAAEMIQKNLAEHQQGIGPEVVALLVQGADGGFGTEGTSAESSSAPAAGASTNVQEDHGNSLSQQ